MPPPPAAQAVGDASKGPMNAFNTICRTAAVALLAGLLACAGVAPAIAATPKDLKITLPTAPVLATPIAVSGKNLLVSSDGTYRLSHDNGKHWVTAKVPNTCASCLASPSDFGQVADGVVTISYGTNSLEAYSLAKNARVGSPYRVPEDHNVMDRVGGWALLYNPDTGGGTVHSLTTGATHEVTTPSGYSLNFSKLLPDGAVLFGDDRGAHSWTRVSPTGAVTTVFTGSSTTYLDRVSGNLLLFTSTADSITTLCLVALPSTVPSCRAGVGIRLSALAMSSTGILVMGHYQVLRWYPIVSGRVGASTPVSGVKLHAGAYAPVLSVENAYPVIAQRSATSSWLKRLTTRARSVTVSLGWARQLVDVTSLALTPTTLLGTYAGSSSKYSYAWWRGASGKLGGQHRLSASGSTGLAASGSRWATSDEWVDMRLYDRARQTTVIGAGGDRVVRQSGPYLLADPFCHPPLGDPDPSCDPLEILDHAGRTLVNPANASDIFGTMAVQKSSGDAAYTVRDFLDPSAPVFPIALPDPGPDGSYSDTAIWGDWVAATKSPVNASDEQVVVHNYRTGVTRTSPLKGSLLALGDGFAVVYVSASAQLKVWNFTTGTLTSLTPAGPATGALVTDGSRVAFVKGGSLVVKTIAGAGKSAPRVLGVVAPTALKGTWKAAIDLTKVVRSGRLEIRDSAGKLVRSLTVKATKDGSLRGITWNGRNKAGKRVTTGSYTYALTNRAADGSGAIRLVNGSVGPIGTIQVP